jgi:hypothetical protein
MALPEAVSLPVLVVGRPPEVSLRQVINTILYNLKRRPVNSGGNYPVNFRADGGVYYFRRWSAPMARGGTAASLAARQAACERNIDAINTPWQEA